MTLITPEAPQQPKPVFRRRPLWLIALIATLTFLLGLAVGVLAFPDDGASEHELADAKEGNALLTERVSDAYGTIARMAKDKAEMKHAIAALEARVRRLRSASDRPASGGTPATEQATPPDEIGGASSAFPPGYPKVVSVASMPSPVGDSYEQDGYQQAVAIAPGVWTPLPPGASMRDAAASGVLDGFCASIKAYERKYTPGEQHGGSCW